MNLAHILTQQAQTRPDELALIDTRHGAERITTFAQLENASARAATLLNSLGLKAGDAVLVFQPMSFELYSVLIALFRKGLVAVVVDPSAGREHLARCCELYPPKALVASHKAHLLRLLFPALRRVPVKLSTGLGLPGAVSLRRSEHLNGDADIYSCDVDTPALVTFTSGSTGQPKAAVRTHGFLKAQHRALERSLELKAGESDLSTLPIFVLANLASGVTSLIPNVDLRKPGKVKARRVVEMLMKHKPTRLSASPAFLERVVGYCETRDTKLASLEHVFTGGAPVFPDLLERAQKVAPNAAVTGVYGSTEAEPMAHISYHELTPEDKNAMRGGKGLLTGCPTPDIGVRILQDHWGTPLAPLTQETFTSLCCKTDEVGEIVVSGDHVLKGYLNGVGDEETKFDVGQTRWHRTGDAGYLDADGRLWLLGRCGAVVRDERGTLYPFAVECAAQQPDLERVAAVSHRNERILLIEPKKGSKPDLEALKKRLAWAHLNEVRVIHIPVDKRHNAKVDYRALERLLG